MNQYWNWTLAQMENELPKIQAKLAEGNLTALFSIAYKRDLKDLTDAMESKKALLARTQAFLAKAG